MLNNANNGSIDNLTKLASEIAQGTKRTYTHEMDYSHIDPRFVGKIVFHHPSQLEQMQIGIRRAALLGGIVPMDVKTDNLVLMLATFEQVIDYKPDWFDFNNPELDYEILVDAFKAYDNWYHSFRKPSEPGEAKGNSQNS
ncbi:gp10.2 [Bacillus phage SPO1]|uniref:Gp10.2 n=3 Tax=Okubovirus TaxID=1857845 RepID=B6V2P7_BPSP1|nr:tail assembly chaperone [Bacillus phage SPO1]YP_008770018.1 tail assembly chaperone [Bacillus phage CampHawk]APZ82321.1 tail assembly chaperone [Bacillus phage vB_BsuM-Goe2]WIT26417.1 hypothetical protein [Bacillus phage SPO1L4]ACI90987.1 gp10.2 [Bacillus phage SPO1]AGY46962.1 tail assembly chaperone [Bacillus phage CampHawk]